MDKIAQIRAQRSAAFGSFKALAALDTLSVEQQAEFDGLESQIKAFDADIARKVKAQELSAVSAQPVDGQPASVPATVETNKYVKDRTLVIGGMAKMIANGGNLYGARQAAKDIYGENHPVTKALGVSSGPSGGFIVPPDYANDFIELLRPASVVRAAGPRDIPMPRGTMTMPGQASAATASYGGENSPISSSQPSFDQIVATYKKLTGLVPLSNDMLRYAEPAADAVVRDDLVAVLSLRQDLAFLIGDGTANTPRGYLSFANGYALANGGTAGTFSSTANSTYASGGQFITSTESYTQATVANELAGAMNRLDTANVPDKKRCWFMHPRVKNYLFNLLNALGVYVYRDEMKSGMLLGYPFKTTTQIPANLYDTNGSYTTGTFVFLAEMTQSMLFDSMSLEIAVSKEGTYIDGNGVTQSVFQNDQTLIRAIAEHDFQMRHDAAVAVIQGVLWAPAIQ